MTVTRAPSGGKAYVSQNVFDGTRPLSADQRIARLKLIQKAVNKALASRSSDEEVEADRRPLASAE